MRKLMVVLLIMVCGLGVVSAQNTTVENLVRINVGALVLGPLIGIYGLDLSYERVLADWLGLNLSVWGLNDTNSWGIGVGTSLDFFLIGNAPNGFFLNTRTGSVFGEIYGTPTTAMQFGLSAGFQNVYPGGLVLRLGTGASWIVGRRFLPRILASVGYGF